ncbi:TniB family NTP-binding protein [Rhizobium sp. Rhizsp82]|uniref:TniB family NTP-binding protein n=1 Tax=Rhizobium sp. Rhizsp82 TaxID=3243057 RepID=UPI0039B6A2A3
MIDEQRAAVRASMRSQLISVSGETLLRRGRILEELRAIHVETSSDEKFKHELDRLVAHLSVEDVQEGYALVVTGLSGAGKTTIIKHHVSEHRAFRTFKDEHGRDINRALFVQTPAGCTMKSLGEAILARTGYRLARELSDVAIWRQVSEMLFKQRYQVIIFDEFQHALTAPTSKGVGHVTDTVKTLMQDASWPIWVIASGVPQVQDLIERDKWDQMSRRAPVLHIDSLEFATNDSEGDVESVIAVLETLADVAGLKIAIALEREFIHRLIHGGASRWGMTIQLIKLTIESVLFSEEYESPDFLHELRYEHFVTGYRMLSNCKPDTNVFLSDRWYEIQREVTPDKKLATISGPSPSAERKARRKVRDNHA